MLFVSPRLRTAAIALAVASFPTAAVAQQQTAARTPGGGWLVPPAPIPQIVDAPPTPTLMVAPGERMVALLGRASLPPVRELAEPWLSLAGYRVNPRTNGWNAARMSFVNAITLQAVDGGLKREVRLPAGA
ncbi:MAG TPA: hypothetical protein VF705_05505, partial [Longimicrobium sp.]